MNRTGLSSLVGEPDVFGVKSAFRCLVNKAVEQVVSQGKWFTFCKKISEEQVDLAAQKNNAGKTLGQFMAEEYDNSVYRIGVYKYLLRDFLCYYEAPTVVHLRDQAGMKESYNKNLITSNLYVVAEWLGISIEEAESQYGSRLFRANYNDDDDTFQYVKLYSDKQGNHKVTKPRKDLDLSIRGSRVVPLFALKTGVDKIYEMANHDFYDVHFLKDAGSKRVVNVCFNIQKLREVYKDDGLLIDMYQSQFDGNFLGLKTLERGYIRIIEVGTNIKSNPLRSINFARIYKIEKENPDLTFLNVDLDSVVDTFKNSLLYLRGVSVEDIVESLDMFEVGTERKYGGKPIKTVSDLEGWVDTNVMLLSTPFIKQLALFMMGNPQWFNNYTGESHKPVPVEISAGDEGGEGQSVGFEIDDDDFSLDLV